MKFGQATGSRSTADHPDRRLIGGLLVSLLVHGLILLLQFGVPGLGLPGAPPLTVRIAAADVAPAPLPPPVPVPVSDTDAAPPLLPPPRSVTGLQLVEPVVAPPPPVVKATPAVKKDKPRKAKRISTPLVAHETLVEPSRVIAQDSVINDFSVPLARPEEAEEKTIDLKQAQQGEDDGDAATTAAAEAAEAKAGKIKAEQAALASKQAEEAQEAARRAAELAAAAQRVAEQQAQQAAAKKLEDEQQAAQLQKSEQEAARVREQQLAQQKVDELKLAEQRKQEQQKVAEQKAEQLKLEQKKTEQLAAERQKAEQLKLEQQRAEQARLAQQAEQQRAEQRRLEQQRLEQQRLDQQRAEQQRAEQQRAEQQRAERERGEREAATQRGRELAAAQPGIAGQGGPATGTGSGGGSVQIPRNMMGSDLGNRARDLVKGLDVLRGAPPVGRRPGERRAVVSFNERDLPLKMYVESWRQKVERNGALNYPRSWADAVRIDPLVSVAVRSDGTVEDVVIVASSGRADMDEAVRRIVRVNARYAPFPPQIAEKYDVIEIRRVWRFDDSLKLMEELH
jgi:TonB family protein